MDLKDCERLSEAAHEACDAIVKLAESLKPFWEQVPELFVKPLAEMDAGDKVRTALALDRIFGLPGTITPDE